MSRYHHLLNVFYFISASISIITSIVEAAKLHVFYLVDYINIYENVIYTTNILIELKMLIPVISISEQRICRREIRVDKKLYGLIAYDEFVLLVKKTVQESQKYFTLTARAISVTDS